MANMMLGNGATTTTFVSNPSDMTLIKPKIYATAKPTWDSIIYYSWGPTIKGLELELDWDYMSTAQYEELDTIFQADIVSLFDPQDGTSKQYNVRMRELTGKYHMALENSTGNYRRDVKLILVILDEA